MTEQELQLEALAKAATQGVWAAFTPNEGSASLNPSDATLLIGPARVCIDRSAAFKKEDAAYIAAANPSTILSLLERIRELEQKQ